MKILFVQKVKALVGSEKYFLELLPELERRGVETHFACVYNSFDKEKVLPFIEAMQALKLKIDVLEVPSDKSILKTLKFIGNITKSENFDLVHSHLIHADFWASLLKRSGKIKCPLVSTKHGYDEAYISKHGFDSTHIKRNLYYRLCKFSEKKVKQSFAVSNGLKNLFIKSGICNPKNITTIHHGFNLPDVEDRISNAYRFSKNQLVILGRIIPFKGHLLAIDALIEVKKELKDFKLLIIGHGDQDLIDTLKLKIKENNLSENVDFLGYKSNIYDYLVNSDLMIVPSIAEGFGLIFLEAMNAKLPIIGFDVPATNEIIEHDKSGKIIPPYDTQKMAKEILKVLKSDEIKKDLKAGAYFRQKNYFCLDRMVNETIEFYKNALEK